MNYSLDLENHSHALHLIHHFTNPFHRIVMNNPMLKYRDLDLIIKHICQDGILNIYYIETVEGIGEVMNQMESMGMVLQVKRIVHGYSRNMFMFSLEYRKVLK